MMYSILIQLKTEICTHFVHNYFGIFVIHLVKKCEFLCGHHVSLMKKCDSLCR